MAADKPFVCFLSRNIYGASFSYTRTMRSLNKQLEKKKGKRDDDREERRKERKKRKIAVYTEIDAENILNDFRSERFSLTSSRWQRCIQVCIYIYIYTYGRKKLQTSIVSQ